MTRRSAQPVLARYSKPYDGFNDTRKRQFRIRNSQTGQVVIVKGCTLSDAVDLLRFDPNAVQWVDMGTVRATQPVYLSVRGWEKIVHPLEPIFQPDKEA